MAYEPSGVTIIIFIAVGSLFTVMLFIFTKRQLMRLNLKSKRALYPPPWNLAPKALVQEIERRLERIGVIQIEPRLGKEDSGSLNYHYRIQAVDDLKSITSELSSCGVSVSLLPGAHLRHLLISQVGGLLKGLDTRVIHELCDYYEHARYLPEPFNQEEYSRYSHLLKSVIQSIQQNQSIVESGVSPSYTHRSDPHSGSQDSAIEQDHSGSSNDEKQAKVSASNEDDSHETTV